MGSASLIVLAALATLLAACGPTASTPEPGPGSTNQAPTGPVADGEIVVFAATSLTDAFQELGERFEAAHPNVRVVFSFGASSQLRTQLEQGARADVFASANQAEMDKARAAGVISTADRVFARNRLAVIVPRANPGQVSGLDDLARPGLRLVTAGEEVPIGAYTQDMLAKMSQDAAFGPDFRDRVNANIVSREANVRQMVAKVVLGEADAAVVYSSDVTPDVASRLGRLEVPDRFNTLAAYPLSLVLNAPNAAAAEAFTTFVLSPAGQAVLQRWGFLPVTG